MLTVCGKTVLTAGPPFAEPPFAGLPIAAPKMPLLFPPLPPRIFPSLNRGHNSTRTSEREEKRTKLEGSAKFWALHPSGPTTFWAPPFCALIFRGFGPGVLNFSILGGANFVAISCVSFLCERSTFSAPREEGAVFSFSFLVPVAALQLSLLLLLRLLLLQLFGLLLLLLLPLLLLLLLLLFLLCLPLLLLPLLLPLLCLPQFVLLLLLCLLFLLLLLL